MKLGDIIHDNDPIRGNRKLKIISINSTHVRVRQINAEGKFTIGPEGGYRILKDKIYCDGQKRKKGLTLQII